MLWFHENRFASTPAALPLHHKAPLEVATELFHEPQGFQREGGEQRQGRLLGRDDFSRISIVQSGKFVAAITCFSPFLFLSNHYLYFKGRFYGSLCSVKEHLTPLKVCELEDPACFLYQRLSCFFGKYQKLGWKTSSK